MRYIRTIDGRIIDMSPFFPLYKNDKPYTGIGIGQYMGVPIIEQADTIEELCDCFVRWKSELYTKATIGGVIDIDIMGIRSVLVGIYKRINKAKRGFEYQTSEKLYGAIWTDKGLKYIAKMNDEGEFELL